MNFGKNKQNHWDYKNFILCFLSEALRAGSIKPNEIPKLTEILEQMAQVGSITPKSKLSEEIRKIQIAFDTTTALPSEKEDIKDSVVIEEDKVNLVIPKENNVVQNPLSQNSTLKLEVTENK